MLKIVNKCSSLFKIQIEYELMQELCCIEQCINGILQMNTLRFIESMIPFKR